VCVHVFVDSKARETPGETLTDIYSATVRGCVRMPTTTASRHEWAGRVRIHDITNCVDIIRSFLTIYTRMFKVGSLMTLVNHRAASDLYRNIALIQNRHEFHRLTQPETTGVADIRYRRALYRLFRDNLWGNYMMLLETLEAQFHVNMTLTRAIRGVMPRDTTRRAWFVRERVRLDQCHTACSDCVWALSDLCNMLATFYDGDGTEYTLAATGVVGTEYTPAATGVVGTEYTLAATGVVVPIPASSVELSDVELDLVGVDRPLCEQGV
jgi:hypothetical protein